MEQVTLSKERYNELLSCEAELKAIRNRRSKSSDIVERAILSTAWDRADGSGKMTHLMLLREAMKSMYTTGGDRARQRALQSGLEKLEAAGKIKFVENSPKHILVCF